MSEEGRHAEGGVKYEEKEEEEEEVDNTTPGGSTAGEPPEDDREPGSDGQEVGSGGRSASDRESESEASDAEQLQEAQEAEHAEDVQVTEAGADTDLPNDNAKTHKELQETENAGSSTATVKVALVPEGHVMTVAFPIGLSIQELKRHLASELRVPAEVLQLSLDGRVVEEQQSLMELGVRPHSSTRMEMNSTDPSFHPLRPLRLLEQDSMPDVITVQVQTGEGLLKQVVVEMERPRQQKAFLGGYRHRLTGVEYHHAPTQTPAKKRPDRGVEVFSRSTQLAKTQAQQCPVDASTQMTGIGCYVSCMNDKLVTPGKYVTADEYQESRLRAVMCLQSHVRRWLATQRVDQLRRERARRLVWLEMNERRRIEEKEEQLRDRRRRWRNPQTREDFNLMYQALEKWRREEEQQINASLTGTERRAALCSLLDQETKLIAAIGRYRIAFQSNNYDKMIKSFLDKTAAPYQWRAADGRLIQMETPQTIRAKQLRDLYDDISRLTVSQEQRLRALMAVKDTVKEHECQLTQDIIDLIDREVDLMARRFKAENLEGLRRRICTLFLQFIKLPEFNPEVAKVLKVPQSPSQLKNNLLLCHSCHRYLRSTDFDVSATGQKSSRCRHCAQLDNIGRTRDDFSCYKNILRRLRAEELQLNKEAKIPFILQVEDMKYLVDTIWASRSALNKDSDLDNLVFLRWDRLRDWSPWNCILLSKQETSAHLKVEDIHKTYGTPFICQVEYKHSRGRQHFSQIPVIAELLNS
ncbi:IQ and ubiquitin-like domain-containing protein [Parambassis ranga]|uniref:IQ and ubiquitin-like domain-containing protein n=1 Tax=Parambassis ranga TaxID=210632 RepID=A0A6P7KFK2_9TELE|nr:IQ and ubiquitin-like domain-containing protein [Parambassis ranga]